MFLFSKPTKPSKLFILPLKTFILATFGLLSSPCVADVLIMKDGSKIQGTIIDQTLETYTLKVEIAENILSRKTVNIRDIKEIIRTDKTALALKNIKALFPTKDGMTASDYTKLKKQYFDACYRTYPHSKYTNQVKELETELLKEQNIIQDGGLKIAGKLLTKQQVDSNRLEIMAAIEYNKVANLANSRNYLSALRVFEAMEGSYLNTKPFRDTIKTIQSFLPKFKSTLTAKLKAVDSEIEKRERHLKALPANEMPRIKRLLEEAEENYQRSLKEAKSKTKWIPVNKYVKPPIEEVLQHIDSESTRITRIASQELNDAGKLYRDLLTMISDNDYQAAHAMLNQFERTNPPAEYLATIKAGINRLSEENALKQEKEKAAAAAAAESKRKNLAEKKAADKNKKNN